MWYNYFIKFRGDIMPATVTHAFFANDVYDVLPENIKSKLDFDRCKMFSQSVDSLYFYNLFSIMPGKKIRDFQKFFHTNKSQDFFINVLKYIRDNKLNDIDSFSFLMGFICHFVLDSTIHPYIIYKTGVFRKKNPATYKYNNVHAFMEVFLDNDVIVKRLNQNPYHFNFIKYCFDLHPFSEDLEHLIDYSFYNTFKLRNMSAIYYKSLKQMKTDLAIFRKDPWGIKKNIYKAIDTFTPRRVFRFEAVSYHYPLHDRHNYLNSNHSMWRNPAAYGITSTESFVDLYIKAIKQAKIIICASFDYFDGKTIDLEKIFPNISYLTGLDCSIKKELKYFEF